MKHEATIHELTTAEIARQVAVHTERRREIVEKRAYLFTNSAGTGARPMLDAEEKASRAHAKRLLNGNAPEFLNSHASEFDFASADKQLEVEQRGLDLVIKILSQKEVAIRAAEAVSWAELHANEWRKLAREAILAAARAEAIAAAAANLLASCPDADAITWPMVNLVGQEFVKTSGAYTAMVLVKPDDLAEAGLAAGFVTKREIADAKKV
jgi:hypothetical protein